MCLGRVTVILDRPKLFRSLSIIMQKKLWRLSPVEQNGSSAENDRRDRLAFEASRPNLFYFLSVSFLYAVEVDQQRENAPRLRVKATRNYTKI